MAVTDTEKEALTSVGKQLRAIASGTSGARAREILRLAGVVETVADGEDLADVEVVLGDKPSTPAPERSATPSPGQQPPVNSTPGTTVTPLTEVKPPVS